MPLLSMVLLSRMARPSSTRMLSRMEHKRCRGAQVSQFLTWPAHCMRESCDDRRVSVGLLFLRVVLGTKMIPRRWCLEFRLQTLCTSVHSSIVNTMSLLCAANLRTHEDQIVLISHMQAVYVFNKRAHEL